MEHNKEVVGFLCFLGLIVICFGVWFTIVGYEKSDKHEPQKLVDHKKQLKWVGPVLIGVGAMWFICCLMKMKGSGGHPAVTSNFGFRFY
jgi:hypothetical protein